MNTLPQIQKPWMTAQSPTINIFMYQVQQVSVEPDDYIPITITLDIPRELKLESKT